MIVAALNSEQTIGECLKSIFEIDYPQDLLEVIVMDGGSRDATVKIAEKYPAKVVSAPLNAPAAYNYAMKTITNEVVGFIDADAKVEKEWLSKLVGHLSDPQVAGASGSIETWNVENAWARCIGYDLKNRYARIGKYVGRVATMNLLLKKSIIEAAGGFDEKLPSQYDTDLGFRISAMGYKIAYEPSAKCYHFNRSTVRAYFRQQLQYGKNTLKLYFKHAGLARGDEITDFAMNVQPILILAVVVFAILGTFEVLRLLWYVAGALLLVMFVYYLFSAVRVAVKFKDKTAMRLLVLYFVRSFAWFAGAVITSVRYIAGDRR
ncbi:MAG: glycosyltransferase [Candidatus Bathyarchaeota archaeon]|nr:glycosyltransferase [Candidatus Bathyarchaeota archaeon]